MQRPKSSSLFHYTRSLENLKRILKDGLYPRYCLEDTQWMNIPFTAYPMVCFCDIPLSRISEHTAFYGSYGIGLTKEWGLRNSLVPLIYSPPKGPVPSFLNYVIDMDTEQTKTLASAASELSQHFMRMAVHVKPISGNMIIGGEVVEKVFYQENEWRFVAPELDATFREEFEEKRASLNKEAEKHVLKFTPQDVKYVFVQSEAEIPEIFDFIYTQLGHWPHNDVKILTSRITSLETLAGDV